MTDNDKRKFLRFGAFLEGTFHLDDGKSGLVMLTNFSKGGAKASLNRNVPPHTPMNIELWMPGSIIPVFSTGTVMWIRKSSKEWTYQFDAGIKVGHMDEDDYQRVMNFAYQYWRQNREQV
jgi:PilZ domain.